MDDQHCRRLADAISVLINRFKVGSERPSYEQLTLTDAAVLSWLLQASTEGREPIQQEVADSLGLPKTTMASAVKRLTVRTLVVQSAGSTDARAKTLQLTSMGQALAVRLRQAQLEASMSMLESLPSRDQTRLIELLETVVENTPPEK